MNLCQIPAGVRADRLCPRGACAKCDAIMRTLLVAFAVARMLERPTLDGQNATLEAFGGAP